MYRYNSQLVIFFYLHQSSRLLRLIPIHTGVITLTVSPFLCLLYGLFPPALIAWTPDNNIETNKFNEHANSHANDHTGDPTKVVNEKYAWYFLKSKCVCKWHAHTEICNKINQWGRLLITNGLNCALVHTLVEVHCHQNDIVNVKITGLCEHLFAVGENS